MSDPSPGVGKRGPENVGGPSPVQKDAQSRRNGGGRQFWGVSKGTSQLRGVPRVVDVPDGGPETVGVPGPGRE